MTAGRLRTRSSPLSMEILEFPYCSLCFFVAMLLTYHKSIVIHNKSIVLYPKSSILSNFSLWGCPHGQFRDWLAGGSRYTIGPTRFVTAIQISVWRAVPADNASLIGRQVSMRHRAHPIRYCYSNFSLSHCCYRPVVDAILRIAGNGLPHQCAHWFAMTVVFDDFRINSGAESYQISCHCEERSDVAIRVPASEGCCRPIRATFGIHNSTININLAFCIHSTTKTKS